MNSPRPPVTRSVCEHARRLLLLLLLLFFLLAASSPLHAQDRTDTIDQSVAPQYSTTAIHWVPTLLLVTAALFLAALITGPLIRLRQSDMPPTHSHDEPPGSSGHHGTNGVYDTHGAPEEPGPSAT